MSEALCPIHGTYLPCLRCADGTTYSPLTDPGIRGHAERARLRMMKRLAEALKAASTLDAQRRQKEIEGAREAGRLNRKAPAAEVLEREVRELHERAPYLSWSEVCTKVGRKYNISRQTVARHAAAADWRSEPQ